MTYREPWQEEGEEVVSEWRVGWWWVLVSGVLLVSLFVTLLVTLSRGDYESVATYQRVTVAPFNATEQCTAKGSPPDCQQSTRRWYVHTVYADQHFRMEVDSIAHTYVRRWSCVRVNVMPHGSGVHLVFAGLADERLCGR